VEDHSGAAQVLAVGRVDFHVLQPFTISALFQAPVGGPLGGTTVAGGLVLRGRF
jgi:hypothetical protein